MFTATATHRSAPRSILKSALGTLVLAGGLITSSLAHAETGIVQEVRCLALNIYFEARGEPTADKRAVGHVVMNRVSSKRFPRSICGVIRQGGEARRHRCQFSWWCDGRSDQPRHRKAWAESREIAKEIYTGVSADPTGGALWYHADYVSPYWRKAFDRGPKIGRHFFYTKATRKNRRAAKTAQLKTAAATAPVAPETQITALLPTAADVSDITWNAGMGLAIAIAATQETS